METKARKLGNQAVVGSCCLVIKSHLATSLSLFTFMHWRMKWQPTPVFLPGESQGRGSLVGYRLWGRTVRHDWSNLAAAAAAMTIIMLCVGYFCLWLTSLIDSKLIELRSIVTFSHLSIWGTLYENKNYTSLFSVTSVLITHIMINTFCWNKYLCKWKLIWGLGSLVSDRLSVGTRNYGIRARYLCPIFKWALKNSSNLKVSLP